VCEVLLDFIHCRPKYVSILYRHIQRRILAGIYAPIFDAECVTVGIVEFNVPLDTL